MLGTERADQPVLRAVDVLILVDHHVTEPLGQLRADRQLPLDQPHGAQDQVVEVDRVLCAQLLLVPLVDAAEDPLGRRDQAVEISDVLIVVEQLVL